MAIDVKGLFREFLLIIFLYCLDLGTGFGCYSEIYKSRSQYQQWLKPDHNYVYNNTKEFGPCKEGTFWDREIYERELKLYSRLSDAYLFFLVISGAVFLCYILAYLWFVLRSWHKPTFLEDNRDHIVKVKFTFGFILSFTLDIPGSCIAVFLYHMRHGERGLHCWDCSQDVTCDKVLEFLFRQKISRSVIILMFFGLVLVSLWKGITTFYRWSKTDKVDCWQLRGCVALFVGTYYVAIILTPALGVFKYEFFKLPSQHGNVFANFTDSLFMIGLLGWLIFMVIGCCFPIIRYIRIGTPTSILNTKKTYQNV